MNNAVFCAVRPSKISYVNNRTVLTSVKEQISFVIKPGFFFFPCHSLYFVGFICFLVVFGTPIYLCSCTLNMKWLVNFILILQ